MWRQFMGLFQDGKAGPKGPGFLQVMMMAREFSDVMAIAGPPLFLQQAVAALVAPIGRFRGYSGRYQEYLTGDLRRSWSSSRCPRSRLRGRWDPPLIQNLTGTVAYSPLRPAIVSRIRSGSGCSSRRPPGRASKWKWQLPRFTAAARATAIHTACNDHVQTRHLRRPS
jgi:hypothetical protein